MGKPHRLFPLTAAFSRWLFFIFFLQVSCAAAGTDLFQIPQNIHAITLSTRSVQGICIQEVTYVSGSFKGKPVKIFGYFCYPQKLRTYGLPGVVLVHGGAGRADFARAMAWARRGYAALVIDLPGKGEKRGGSRSTGPDMDVSVLLRVKPDLSYNYLYHAVRAARCGITFLEQQRFVNKGIAMVGLSWGGVITLLVNGTDERLSAAVPVFGSGFLDQGSTWQEWFDVRMPKDDLKKYNENFDARNYLKSQHAPLFYLTGTNDHCFYLPLFIRSYLAISSECTLSLFPNVRHIVSTDMNNNIYSYVAYKLKGGSGFPWIKLEELSNKGDHVSIKIKAGGTEKLRSVKLFYAHGGSDKWTKKAWKPISAYKSKGKYVVVIPKNIISPEIVFYAAARNTAGNQTTTPVYSLMRLKVSDGRDMAILSEPIEKIFERKISKETWFEILNTTAEAQSLPFGYLCKDGAKLTKGANCYYLNLPNM